MRWFRFATAIVAMCLSSAPAGAPGLGVRISLAPRQIDTQVMFNARLLF
ncbi:MAG TPA: hypothetical protein VNM70_21580 [Burkholderiales bacterium]|nr:hypothetical protein [Burkholderiales bacterium]